MSIKKRKKVDVRAANSVGRPSEFTSEIEDLLLTHISNGGTLTAFCKAHKIGAPTIRRWKRNNEEFRFRYAQAQLDQWEVWGDQIISVSDDGSEDVVFNDEGKAITNWENVQRSRLRVDSRKWLLSKLLPRQYGDKVEVEQNTTINYVIASDPMSEKEFEKLYESRGANNLGTSARTTESIN